MFSCNCFICGSPLQDKGWSVRYSCVESWPCHHELIFNGTYELIIEIVCYKHNGHEIKAIINFSKHETHIEVTELKSYKLIQDIVVPCYCRQLDKIKNYIVIS